MSHDKPSFDPESVVLANIMRNAKQREEYVEKTDVTDFTHKGYDVIYKTFLRMVSNQSQINREAVYNAFTDTFHKTIVSFLYTQTMPPITPEIFDRFKKAGTFNRLVKMRDYLANQIQTAKTEDIPTILEKIREMTDVIDGVQTDLNVSEPTESVDKTISMIDDWKRGDTKIKSFLPEFDGKLFLSRFVGFWVFAAPPSFGKTALLCDIGWNNAVNGNPFAMFSLEMPEEMLRLRLAMRDPKCWGLELTDANLTDEQKVSDLKYVLEAQRKKPFYIIDKVFNVFSCYSITRRLSVSKRVRGIGFDYIQLGQTTPTDSDVVRVSTVSTTLKLLTKGDIKKGWHPVAVLAGSQYSGAGSGDSFEKKDGNSSYVKTKKQYTDNDLRWSGQIQMDADGIVHLRGSKSGQDRITVELDCTKQRWYKANWKVATVFDKPKQIFETVRSKSMNEDSLLRPMEEERDVDFF